MFPPPWFQGREFEKYGKTKILTIAKFLEE
jgi:hypothetical protein